MRDKRKIPAGLEIKFKDSTSLYHAIQGFMNMRQGETDPKDDFKLRFDNIYETIELAGGYNTLCIKQLTNNGIQASTK